MSDRELPHEDDPTRCGRSLATASGGVGLTWSPCVRRFGHSPEPCLPEFSMVEEARLDGLEAEIAVARRRLLELETQRDVLVARKRRVQEGRGK